MVAALPPPELSEIELRFVEEYCVDLQPTAAAKRAGIPASTASRRGNEMLRQDQIKYAIDIRRDEMNKQSVVSAEWVRTQLKAIVERCMQASPVMIRGTGGEMVESGEYKFDSNGANKALEHLGKHIGMFKDHTVITIEHELKQLTDTQLALRRKALIEEHAALDLVPAADGVFEPAIPQPEKGESNEQHANAGTGSGSTGTDQPGDGDAVESVEFIPGGR